MPSKPAPPIPTEYEEQRLLFQYLAAYESEFPELAFASGDLNGVRLPMGAAAKAKAAGMRAGKPDVFIPARRGTSGGLFVELKRVKHSRVEAWQLAWHNYLRAAGYTCAVCKGHVEALDVILAYLRQPANVPEWYFRTIRQFAGILKKALDEKTARAKRNRKGAKNEFPEIRNCTRRTNRTSRPPN